MHNKDVINLTRFLVYSLVSLLYITTPIYLCNFIRYSLCNILSYIMGTQGLPRVVQTLATTLSGFNSCFIRKSLLYDSWQSIVIHEVKCCEHIAIVINTQSFWLHFVCTY